MAVEILTSNIQTIRARSFAQTERQGRRVKASCEGGSVTLPWDHAQDDRGNYEAAAKALLKKMKWSGTWIGARLPHEGGRIFVCTTPAND